MRKIKLLDWSTGMRLCRQPNLEVGVEVECDSGKEGTTNLDKGNRSERLAAGLVRLAQKCHVSFPLPRSDISKRKLMG